MIRNINLLYSTYLMIEIWCKTWTFEHSQKSTNKKTRKNEHVAPKNHPIEKEHHLKQTSILRVQNVHFPGCTALQCPLQLPKCKKAVKPQWPSCPQGFWPSSQHRGRQAKESRCGFPSAEFMFQHFRIQKIKDLSGGFRYFLFSPLFREDFQFD